MKSKGFNPFNPPAAVWLLKTFSTCHPMPDSCVEWCCHYCGGWIKPNTFTDNEKKRFGIFGLITAGNRPLQQIKLAHVSVEAFQSQITSLELFVTALGDNTALMLLSDLCGLNVKQLLCSNSTQLALPSSLRLQKATKKQTWNLDPII